MQQQQQEEAEQYNREEEYLAAQRAASEALAIGRETVETVVQQGEQLRNAENDADETEYKLDRAARLLRGMTWAGWVANKFTKDILPPEYRQKSADQLEAEGPPRVYDSVPEECQAAAQAIQNYHCNLLVLESCETEEQKETCIVICDNMFQMASKQITALHQLDLAEQNNNDDVRKFTARLTNDLATLQHRQKGSQKCKRGITTMENASCSPEKAELFSGATKRQAEAATSPQSPNDLVAIQQEEHLDSMAQHLSELNMVAHSLNQSMGDQKETLEALDAKSESMLFKSRMVTRRADRLIQKKSWNKAKNEFVFNVFIRHTKSGKYLAVSTNNTLLLSSKYNETCIFGLWKRQGTIFGLQSKYSRRWMGQNLLGNLVCSATGFSRREEWDTDDDWSQTPLLCTSAGWGNGGYLLVRPDDEVITIGGGGLVDKKAADLWCIQEKE